MSDSNNPFASQVARANQPSGKANRVAWILTGVMGAAVVTLLILWSSDHAQRSKDIESIRYNLEQKNSALSGALAEIKTNESTIASLKEQIDKLQKEKDAVAQSSKSLEDEMRSQLESKDVTISTLQGKLTVNILDRVMFDSGEAVLKPDGEGVMRKIATILREHQQLRIHVVGHTDNVPIRPGAQSRFASNWELSAARALAAVHFLTEQTGVDPHRVGAIGYGEFRPVADNSTAEGRAKNRRIAITILPDELGPIDTLPVAKGATETNGSIAVSNLKKSD